ncbi:MAG: hypothetical protein ABEJ56_01970 [Candidatus Nanohaloarchaea archaeon]
MEKPDKTYRAINLIEKYGEDSIEWKSDRKKELVREKHGIDPERIMEIIEAKDFDRCISNPNPRTGFNYTESFIVESEKSEDFRPKKYTFRIPIYFTETGEIKIATAWKIER